MKRFSDVILAAILAILIASFYFTTATWHIWIATVMICLVAFIAYKKGRRSGLRAALLTIEDETATGD